jgi:hypothetical protein
MSRKKVHTINYIMFRIITVPLCISNAYATPISDALQLKISNSSYSDETVIRYLCLIQMQENSKSIFPC